jgi:hypothetical protein
MSFCQGKKKVHTSKISLKHFPKHEKINHTDNALPLPFHVPIHHYTWKDHQRENGTN